MPPMAFYGLERALWELHLPNNKLVRIPAASIGLLKKLAVLNLSSEYSIKIVRMIDKFVKPYEDGKPTTKLKDNVY